MVISTLWYWTSNWNMRLQGFSGESRSISIINSEVTRGTHSVKIHGDKFQDLMEKISSLCGHCSKKRCQRRDYHPHKSLHSSPWHSSFNCKSSELTFMILCRSIIKQLLTYMLLNNQNFFFLIFFNTRNMKNISNINNSYMVSKSMKRTNEKITRIWGK